MFVHFVHFVHPEVDQKPNHPSCSWVNCQVIKTWGVRSSAVIFAKPPALNLRQKSRGLWTSVAMFKKKNGSILVFLQLVLVNTVNYNKDSLENKLTNHKDFEASIFKIDMVNGVPHDGLLDVLRQARPRVPRLVFLQGPGKLTKNMCVCINIYI